MVGRFLNHYSYIRLWCCQFIHARGTIAPFLRLGEVGRVRALKRVTNHARNAAVLVTKRILIHTVYLPPLTAISPQPPPLYKRPLFLADVPYTDSCLNLSTTVTSPQRSISLDLNVAVVSVVERFNCIPLIENVPAEDIMGSCCLAITEIILEK